MVHVHHVLYRIKSYTTKKQRRGRTHSSREGKGSSTLHFRAEYVDTFFSFHVLETSIFLLPKTGLRRVSFRCSFILRCNIEATRDPLPFPGAPPRRFLRFIVIITSWSTSRKKTTIYRQFFWRVVYITYLKHTLSLYRVPGLSYSISITAHPQISSCVSFKMCIVFTQYYIFGMIMYEGILYIHLSIYI